VDECERSSYERNVKSQIAASPKAELVFFQSADEACFSESQD